MLQGAIIGAVAGLVLYFIQQRNKKQQKESEVIDQNDPLEEETKEKGDE